MWGLKKRKLLIKHTCFNPLLIQRPLNLWSQHILYTIYIEHEMVYNIRLLLYLLTLKSVLSTYSNIRAGVLD